MQRKVTYQVVTDAAYDARLTDFGKKTLEDRYLLPGESYQDMFARVAGYYGDNPEHAQRIYTYMAKLWFMPATPILSNGGTTKGLPISCFLNNADDSMDDIAATWDENIWLGKNGGGIGTYWGGVRSIDEPISNVGKTSGVIPFIKVMDAITQAVAQGNQRRGAGAAYLDVHHPEVEEFLEIRKASGDFSRKTMYLHHGLNITDEFMYAVTEGIMFALRSPKSGKVTKMVNARELWARILETRLQTGEPYLIFSDTASEAMPSHLKMLGMKVRQSNLCAEIMLHTGKDHLGTDRTAVCCLSSVNAETFLEWKGEPMFIEDIMRFLDNVLQDFIDRAPQKMWRAKYSAQRERSVGLGLMGFHSALQARGIAFGSPMAKGFNMQLFKHLRKGADAASLRLALEKGPCLDAAECGLMERFSHKLAVAPTASISIICGGTSAGIEPIPANIYTHKTLSGSFEVRNQHLNAVLIEAYQKLSLEEHLGSQTEWLNKIWNSILEAGGSIQHLDCLDGLQKEVFKTAFELDQRWIIEMAADRTPEICQSQSVNLFIPSDIDKWDLHMLHYRGWELGMKSFYYIRSRSIQRASFAGQSAEVTMSADDGTGLQSPHQLVSQPQSASYEPDECLACQ